jgi:hypothetical protein
MSRMAWVQWEHEPNGMGGRRKHMVAREQVQVCTMCVGAKGCKVKFVRFGLGYVENKVRTLRLSFDNLVGSRWPNIP